MVTELDMLLMLHAAKAIKSYWPYKPEKGELTKAKASKIRTIILTKHECLHLNSYDTEKSRQLRMGRFFDWQLFPFGWPKEAKANMHTPIRMGGFHIVAAKELNSKKWEGVPCEAFFQ